MSEEKASSHHSPDEQVIGLQSPCLQTMSTNSRLPYEFMLHNVPGGITLLEHSGWPSQDRCWAKATLCFEDKIATYKLGVPLV